MAEEEEVLIEVEAVQSVYGDDCLVLSKLPPHLQVHIKPRTADVSSQQFVEAVVEIKAGTKYPEEPPQVDLIDHKGLDEQRWKDLLAKIQERAHELTTCLMLVALCEEAVERLSAMNHPEGNCPLCLFPLVPEDEDNNSLPFMKLMSCLHCFHSECIIRWWNSIQNDRENNISIGKDKGSGVSEGNCPVCRKVFQTRDIEHVLNLVGSYSSKLNPEGGEATKEEEEEVLELGSEKVRRQKFESILKLQQEKNGLIEPKKDLVVMPGMFLPAAAALPQPHASSSEPSREAAAQEPPLERTNPSVSQRQQQRDQEGSSHARRSTDNRKFSARRRYRGVHNNNNNNARKQSTNCWQVCKDRDIARFLKDKQNSEQREKIETEHVSNPIWDES